MAVFATLTFNEVDELQIAGNVCFFGVVGIAKLPYSTPNSFFESDGILLCCSTECCSCRIETARICVREFVAAFKSSIIGITSNANATRDECLWGTQAARTLPDQDGSQSHQGPNQNWATIVAA